jgi:hypothetical protein
MSMAYLLRALLLLLLFGLLTTIGAAYHLFSFSISHISLAIVLMLFLLFIQAFIMFYFIGVNRLVENIQVTLNTQHDIKELFPDKVPDDLTYYIKSLNRIGYATQLNKRKTVPWAALIMVLFIIGFLLGGSHDTGGVSKDVHVGVILGFCAAFAIGFFKQWIYLGKAHKQLRELKDIFNLSDHAM